MSAQESRAVRLVLLLNRVTPDFSAATVRSKRTLETYSNFEYSRAVSLDKLFGVYFNVADKHVLDVGCGLGGSERRYLERGARSVTALDLSVPRLKAGRCYVHNSLADRAAGSILFSAVDARRMSLPDARFDLIISTNTFEHIVGVETALSECARVLKPGGQLLIAFPPYNAPWGAHLSNWIHFPWCQVIFSEKTLIAAARRIEARQQLNQWMPEEICLDLDGHDEIPHLNRMSVSDFEAIAARSSLKIVHSACYSIGWRSGGLARSAGRLLRRNRRLREYVTSQAVFVFEKAGA